MTTRARAMRCSQRRTQSENPWYVVDYNDQRRGRLNCIAHFLSQVPYEEVPHKKVKLPKRDKAKGYVEPDYPYKFVPAKY